jgi:predicted nuclease of predicted toxin-antitoxin system
MRLLADENFPKTAVTALRQDGHDVLWVRVDQPGASDLEILEWAEADGRLILTLDKDFRQIALQRPAGLHRGGVILFRLHPASVPLLTAMVRSAIGSDRDWVGNISTVSADRIEMVRASGEWRS